MSSTNLTIVIISKYPKVYNTISLAASLISDSLLSIIFILQKYFLLNYEPQVKELKQKIAERIHKKCMKIYYIKPNKMLDDFLH